MADFKVAMSDDRPVYVVFAGVNGAGKSTFYRSGLWRYSDVPTASERINPDEIVRELGGSWASASDQAKAGREALKRIDGCFSRHASLNQETTLSGRSALSRIKRAHDLGYRVVLYYIGVRDAALALERIAHRVEVGGHDIDEAVVRRRFASSLANFFDALPYCARAAVFDNTQEFKCVAEWTDGMLSWWGNPRLYAPWLISRIEKQGS